MEIYTVRKIGTENLTLEMILARKLQLSTTHSATSLSLETWNQISFQINSWFK